MDSWIGSVKSSPGVQTRICKQKKACTQALYRLRLVVNRDGCVNIFWAFWEKSSPTNEIVSRSELGTKVEGVASEKFPWTISDHHVETGLVACPSLQRTLTPMHRQACFRLNHGPLLLTLFNMWHMIFKYNNLWNSSILDWILTIRNNRTRALWFDCHSHLSKDIIRAE